MPSSFYGGMPFGVYNSEQKWILNVYMLKIAPLLQEGSMSNGRALGCDQELSCTWCLLSLSSWPPHKPCDGFMLGQMWIRDWSHHCSCFYFKLSQGLGLLHHNQYQPHLLHEVPFRCLWCVDAILSEQDPGNVCTCACRHIQRPGTQPSSITFCHIPLK